MTNLEKVTELINQSAIKGEIWIDGSFLTEKLNPDDVDFIFVVSAQDYLKMSHDQAQFFDWFRKTRLYDQYRLDNYGIVHSEKIPESELMRSYWMRQFGFSRTDEMKGMALVKVPFLVTS